MRDGMKSLKSEWGKEKQIAAKHTLTIFVLQISWHINFHMQKASITSHFQACFVSNDDTRNAEGLSLSMLTLRAEVQQPVCIAYQLVNQHRLLMEA
jgi:hypothetical protein